MVEGFPAELPAFVGTGLQRRRGFPKARDLGAELLDHAIRRAASTA